MQTKLELTASGRVLVLLASLALGAAWTTGGEAARLGACILVAPLLADWACKAKRFDGLTVAVARRRTRAGAPFLERITVRNHSRHDLWHATFGELGLIASSRGHHALLEHVGRGTDVEVEMPVRARSRGVAAQRTFWLMTQHPLGLVSLSVRLVAETTVVSEPARIDLAPRLRQRRSDDGQSEDAALGSEGETFYALRELRDGDDWSRIHALRSAALGTPVRVLRRGAAQPRVRVVLDLRAAPTRLGRRNLARIFEWGLSATASLVEHLLSSDRRVDVEVLGDGVRRFADLGHHTPLTTLLEFLAEAQPRPWQAAPTELLGEARAEGELFWVLAGPFLASGEREQLGPRVAVWEQATT